MTLKFKKGKTMKDMEQVLLNNASLDELIRMKIEEEFKNKPQKQKPSTKTVTDLKEVPPEQIFTKNSVFKVFNRTNKSETYINGLQADALIGAQQGIREKFMNKTLTAFSTDDTYVQFVKAKIYNV